MGIQMFDELAVQDQRDYLKFLVDTAKTVLNEQGRGDLAGKIEQLFKKPRSGDPRSLGEAHFHEELARRRRYIAEHPNVPFHLRVEGAMLQTLASNKIDLPSKFSKQFEQAVRERPFWPKLPAQPK
jgi:hypothetical protein